MSWSKGLAALSGLVFLAACGFTPLYGERAGQATIAELNAISIDAASDRVGQEIRNQLIDRFGSDPASGSKRYRLSLEIEKQTQALAIQFDDTITRFNLFLTAQFDLVDLSTGAVIYRDTARSIGSYNVVQSEFATLISEQDAAKRAAREVSEEIRMLLSVFFSRRHAETG